VGGFVVCTARASASKQFTSTLMPKPLSQVKRKVVLFSRSTRGPSQSFPPETRLKNTIDGRRTVKRSVWSKKEGTCQQP
jgi:hypothetical protein